MLIALLLSFAYAQDAPVEQEPVAQFDPFPAVCPGANQLSYIGLLYDADMATEVVSCRNDLQLSLSEIALEQARLKSSLELKDDQKVLFMATIADQRTEIAELKKRQERNFWEKSDGPILFVVGAALSGYAVVQVVKAVETN